MNHVSKKNRDQIARWEIQAGFGISDNEHTPVENDEDQQSSIIENKAGPKLQDTDQETEATKILTTDGLSEEDETRRSIDDNDERAPNAQVPAKSNASNDLALSPLPDAPGASAGGEPITTKEQFYRDYNTFLESVGITNRAIPTVMGKTIDLWDLWVSVRSKKMATDELDWQQIAEDLGFNWVDQPPAPEEVRKCYEEHLAPFADAMMNFNDSSDEDDSTEENADADTEEPLPSSPPVLPSLWQSPAAANPKHQHLFPYSSPKRRRIDRSREIPSTPDQVNRTWHLRPQESPGKTSTTSPLLHHGARSNTKNSEGGHIGDRPTSLPSKPQGQKRRLEPETQDFEFNPDTQVYAHDAAEYSDNDSQKETTPSQQLLQEDAATPVVQQQHDRLTPTPRGRLRKPIQPRSPSGDDIQQNKKVTRSARAPPSTRRTQRQTRTLIPSGISKSPHPTNSTAPPGIQPSSATVPETERYRRPSRPKETPEDIIDRFISLGYGRDIVLRSLKATSWIVGNAGQVMEMLKQGEPLPERTTGVWTQRDDNALALVYSKTPPSGAKEERKRAKEFKRLHAKHGVEQIALRKRYLLDELS